MIKIIIMVLAVYRIAYMLYAEDGPYNIFKNLRENLMERYGFENLHHYSYPLKIFIATMRTISDAFECPFCLGIWTAIVVYLSMISDIFILQIIVGIFAIAGGQHIIERFMQNVDEN